MKTPVEIIRNLLEDIDTIGSDTPSHDELMWGYNYARHVLVAKGYSDAKNNKKFFCPQGDKQTAPGLFKSYFDGYNQWLELKGLPLKIWEEF